MSGRDCKLARRDMLRLDRLDAVTRGRLDLHLRRCESCRSLSEGLALIESAPSQVTPISGDHARAIYDRLIPAVHEIAVDLKPTRKRPRSRAAMAWNVGLGFAAAAAAILIAVALVRFLPEGEGNGELPTTQPELEKVAVEHNGVLDRSEGTVVVDSELLDGTVGTFKIRKGTEIAVEESARLNFHIGNEARVALVGDTRWRIGEATENLIEMELDMGRLAVEFDGSTGRMLDVRTPDSIVRVRGTIFTVEVFPRSGTHVSVIEGRVEVVPLRGASQVIELAEGELVRVPEDTEPVELGDAQRALASEVDALDDSFVISAGRLVHFDGSPERVRVEIGDRLVGYSPLTVRLQEGKVSYRISAPGMEPIDGTLLNEQVGEKVDFELAPAPYLTPSVAAGETVIERRARKTASHKQTLRVRWGLVERAHAAMTAGDIPYAIDLLERLVKESSGDKLVSALSLLAECYSSVGRYSEASDTFDRVASLVPGSKIAQNSRYEVGRLSMDRLGDYARARAAFTAYVASSVEGELKEAAYYSLCKLDGRDGAHQEAIHCFNEFLRAFPGGYYEPNARLWRGALYQDVLKRWADAERDLSSFIKAKPRHPRCEEARYRIALGRYQVGDLRGALRAIDEHIKEHPGGQYTVRAKRLRKAIIDPDFSLGSNSK